jgi:alternate signal-mediated exported protein
MADENTRKQRRFTGIIAGVAGIALLLGGTSFALWSQSGSMSTGNITSGNLALNVGTNQWYDISPDRNDEATPTLAGVNGHTITTIGDYRIVPKDVLLDQDPVSIALQGDNMVAQLSIGLSSAYTANPDLAGLSFQYAVVALKSATDIDTSQGSSGFVVPWTDYTPSTSDQVVGYFSAVDDGNLMNSGDTATGSNGGGSADSKATNPPTITMVNHGTATPSPSVDPNYAVLLRVVFADENNTDEVMQTQDLSDFQVKLTQIRTAGTGNFQASAWTPSATTAPTTGA